MCRDLLWLHLDLFFVLSVVITLSPFLPWHRPLPSSVSQEGQSQPNRPPIINSLCQKSAPTTPPSSASLETRQSRVDCGLELWTVAWNGGLSATSPNPFISYARFFSHLPNFDLDIFYIILLHFLLLLLPISLFLFFPFSFSSAFSVLFTLFFDMTPLFSSFCLPIDPLWSPFRALFLAFC